MSHAQDLQLLTAGQHQPGTRTSRGDGFIDVGRAASVAVVLTWFGMIAGISVIEAPLKFRAPGITLALGLGIGRLVFAAVARAEVLFLAVIAACTVLVPGALAARVILLAILAVVVAVQILMLRPALDRRAEIVIAGGGLAPMPGLRVYGRDDPVRGDLPGDPEHPAGAFLQILPRCGRGG